MAIRRGRMIGGVLALLLVASLARTVWVERERRRLTTSYAQAQQVVQELSAERAQLTGQLTEAHRLVEGQAGELTALQQELAGIQEHLDATLAEVASLAREREELRLRHTTLSAQLAAVTEENVQLEAKLSSLSELKQAIREVKRKIWKERWTVWQMRAQGAKEADQERLAAGNRGYVVRQGQSTLGASPRLHVHVLELTSQ